MSCLQHIGSNLADQFKQSTGVSSSLPLLVSNESGTMIFNQKLNNFKTLMNVFEKERKDLTKEDIVSMQQSLWDLVEIFHITQKLDAVDDLDLYEKNHPDDKEEIYKFDKFIKEKAFDYFLSTIDDEKKKQKIQATISMFLPFVKNDMEYYKQLNAEEKEDFINSMSRVFEYSNNSTSLGVESLMESAMRANMSENNNKGVYLIARAVFSKQDNYLKNTWITNAESILSKKQKKGSLFCDELKFANEILMARVELEDNEIDDESTSNGDSFYRDFDTGMLYLFEKACLPNQQMGSESKKYLTSLLWALPEKTVSQAKNKVNDIIRLRKLTNVFSLDDQIEILTSMKGRMENLHEIYPQDIQIII